MNSIRIPLAAIAAAIITTTAASAAPVDLSSWNVDGGGSWTTAADNNSVFQSLNSAPTVFHNGTDSQGLSLAGTIKVESTSDNDFIGFVLGYTQGDINGNSDTDYILVDWKQGTQAGWGAGLSISRVTGPISASGTNTSADAWQHVGSVELLTRANNLGNTGWSDNTTYAFQINFTSTLISVLVDGVLELQVAGSFANGAFGFYNFSQQSVRYAGITEDILPPEIPIPGALPLMLTGMGLVSFLKRRKRKT
ncbi:MAG: PEP-CTERM sorting domain-containing protein [Alphaproteobacteria bacterium]|nr:PEP-CTERM sorting domain-containing protein [Alphaproteobacteria bacterium]